MWKGVYKPKVKMGRSIPASITMRVSRMRAMTVVDMHTCDPMQTQLTTCFRMPMVHVIEDLYIGWWLRSHGGHIPEQRQMWWVKKAPYGYLKIPRARYIQEYTANTQFVEGIGCWHGFRMCCLNPQNKSQLGWSLCPDREFYRTLPRDWNKVFLF